MQEFDHAIKTVLTLKPNTVLDLTFGKQRTIKLKGVTDSQITIPELRADKVLLIEDRGKIRYLVCEAMLQPRRDKLLGFALKTFGNQYLLKKPTLLLIIYLEKGRYASFPNSFENRVGNLSTQFSCNSILLWEHEARILSGELVEFTAFLPLFHKRRDPRTITVQKKLLAQVADPKLREGLTAATILVDIKVFGMEIVEAEFTKKELNMLKKTGLVQDWLSDSEVKGRREGKQEGWQEGQQKGQREGKREGKQEGKLSIVELILKQKLGALSPRLRSQLQKLDDKKLDRLTLRLQQIGNQKDLQAWLKNGKNGVSRHASH